MEKFDQLVSKKLIMGIDAAFAFIGYSLFNISGEKLKLIDIGTFKTQKNEKKTNVRVADDDIERSRKLARGLGEFYEERVTFHNDLLVACEFPHGGAQGARPNRTMGLATGIVSTFFEVYNCPVEVVTPDEVKIAVVGKKTASKKEMMKAISKKFGVEVIKKPNGVYYCILGKEYSATHFEHIADSIGAVLHIEKNSDMYQLFLR